MIVMLIIITRVMHVLSIWTMWSVNGWYIYVILILNLLCLITYKYLNKFYDWSRVLYLLSEWIHMPQIRSWYRITTYWTHFSIYREAHNYNYFSYFVILIIFTISLFWQGGGSNSFPGAYPGIVYQNHPINVTGYLGTLFS